MAIITEIISIQKRHSAKGDYFVTVALVDGDECEGWGKGYKLGEEVEKYFNERYNRAEMRKKSY